MYDIDWDKATEEGKGWDSKERQSHTESILGNKRVLVQLGMLCAVCGYGIERDDVGRETTRFEEV